ncbi:hypothetical protein LX16_4345 [Stackebrandtia albiflava]|uniref:SurA-like protein n=1 Tax=Stackebrandtia albiflava TaxID=406432 RepID=A0A562UR71_9ACTN|nr:hypothetical protein [Stackebrandtia albiflava]TWJ08125.1 hypothetical protein LX16_4345 [Stackebrandtia albiflava]
MKPRMSRRLVLAAVLGIAAAATVSACRVEQGAALFVGDVRVTDTQISEVVDSVPTELFTSGPDQMTTGFGGVRQQVMEAFVVVELGRQVAADTGATPDETADATAREGWTQRTGLPEDNPFVALLGEAEGYRAMLKQGAEPAAPTDEEVADVAANFIAVTGQPLDEASISQLAVTLNGETGQRIVGERRQLADYVAEYDVQTNPRYGRVSVISFYDPSGVMLTVPVPN